jgi:hypothetical protein
MQKKATEDAKATEEAQKKQQEEAQKKQQEEAKAVEAKA